jgi:hypothetical protein
MRRLLCRLGWHGWAVGVGGSYRYCEHCDQGQVWVRRLTGLGRWENI